VPWEAAARKAAELFGSADVCFLQFDRRVVCCLFQLALPTHTPIAEAANHRELTAEELGNLRAAIERGLKQGALAEGMGINHTPGASHWEILEMFRMAAKYHAPLQVHLRYSSLLEPESGMAALEEVIAAAAITGARLHVAHITSMGLKYTPQLIEMISGAGQRGLDVSTECYPYTASSTNLNSAVFDEGWQEKYDITYKDLQWAETRERLTPETFARYRKQGGLVVIHEIPEAAVRVAVADPSIMIASDCLLPDQRFIHADRGPFRAYWGITCAKRKRWT
jgi:dihydroorotase